MMPVMFANSTMKKMVVRIGRKRSPSLRPSRSCAMPPRTKPRPISTTSEAPGDDAHATRADPEDEDDHDHRRGTAPGGSGAPEPPRGNQTGSPGRTCRSKGRGNPAVSGQSWGQVAARLNSAGSSFGAPVRTGATMVGVRNGASARRTSGGHVSTLSESGGDQISHEHLRHPSPVLDPRAPRWVVRCRSRSAAASA